MNKPEIKPGDYVCIGNCEIPVKTGKDVVNKILYLFVGAGCPRGEGLNCWDIFDYCGWSSEEDYFFYSDGDDRDKHGLKRDITEEVMAYINAPEEVPPTSDECSNQQSIQSMEDILSEVFHRIHKEYGLVLNKIDFDRCVIKTLGSKTGVALHNISVEGDLV